MIDQINLLPDIKQQRLRQHRLRRLAVSVTVLVTAIAIGVPLLLLGIMGSQTLFLNRIQSQIDERKSTLQNTPDITTILTVKDHLGSLPALYDQRVKITELLAFLPSVLPTDVALTGIEVDTSGNISFGGVSRTYTAVEKFYQALLYAGITPDFNKVDPDPYTAGFFTNEVLESVGGESGSEVNFTINANFDSQLIDGAPNG